MERVVHHERNEDAGGIGRVEPRRRQRDRDAPRDLARRRLGPGRQHGNEEQRDEDERNATE